MEQQPKKLVKDLSATAIQIIRLNAEMAEEYGTAIEEITACHKLIREQAEKIKTLEAHVTVPVK